MVTEGISQWRILVHFCLFNQFSRFLFFFSSPYLLDLVLLGVPLIFLISLSFFFLSYSFGGGKGEGGWPRKTSQRLFKKILLIILAILFLGKNGFWGVIEGFATCLFIFQPFPASSFFKL
jgi:hypothetical protein